MKQIVTFILITVFFGFQVTPAALAQTLNPDEKRIVDYIDQHNGEAVSFL